MSLKCVKTHLISSATQDRYLARFALFLVPSARSALSHLLCARCQQRQSPSNTPALKHTQQHISVEEETNEQRSPCATQSLSFSPRLLRLLPDHPDERTASVRTCSSGASALRSVWGGWGGGPGGKRGGVGRWTGRSAGRCVCPSQEELPPREESHPVWRSQTWSGQIQVNKRRDQTADKDPEFIWLQAKHVFISADMMEQCRIII